MAMAAVSLVAASSAPAAAHGFFDKVDPPIPQWLFGWAAALVLVVSFVLLGAMWSKPKLAEERWRPLPAVVSRVVTGPVTDVVVGAFGTGLLLVVLWSGFVGRQSVEHNFAPTFVYVIFWVGLVLVSALFGDVFRTLNPWRAISRAMAWGASRIAGRKLKAPFAYPARLGYWPAAAGLGGFAVLELAVSGGTEPRTIALAVTGYSVVTFAAMWLFGIEAWSDRGEAFSVYFNLFSRISVFERRGERLGLRTPLAGLAMMTAVPGLPFLLAVMVGSVSFDGASEGPMGIEVLPQLQKAWQTLGLGPTPATQLAIGVGLIAAVLLVLAFYYLALAGARWVCGPPGIRQLAREFAPSLVPIALAYVGAHYLTLLLYQGQGIVFLASVPLDNGIYYFGTAGGAIDHSLFGATTIWYAQIALVVAGHVAALILAHDRALVIYGRARAALRSQCWMLAMMVGFTVLALWLLSEANG
ncbi:MAG: hypothetical protein Q8P38_02810 [Candidatus Nanopelagicales bacterium]|nr:hypothetical protein [Candidatus Nanopelagicales bacterium]